MSRNLGALTFWKPVGLFRPVMGQLYLFICLIKVYLLIQRNSEFIKMQGSKIKITLGNNITQQNNTSQQYNTTK
jgi:hypothetical protein